MLSDEMKAVVMIARHFPGSRIVRSQDTKEDDDDTRGIGASDKL